MDEMAPSDDGQDAQPAGRERGTPPAKASCLNCGAVLTGEYCSVCGQRAHNPRRLVIGLVQDVIVDTISIDSKLARTLSKLFLRPASLAREYIEGRRVRYTAPFRLYLFSSLVFFLLLWTVVPFDALETSVRAGGDPDTIASETEGPAPEERADAPPQPAGEGPDVVVLGADDPGAAERLDEADTFDCDLSGETPQTTGERLCVSARNIVSQLREAADRVGEDPRLFFAQVRSNIPRAMLVAPLVYALILIVLYVYRRKILIYDHLVVSLYMHAALYAYLSVMILGGAVPLVGGFAPLILVWGWVQAFLVFRRAYGSGWVSSVLKFSVLTIAYYVAVILLLMLGLGYALYQS